VFLGLEVRDPAHDQPTGHLIGCGLGGECGEGDLGDLGPGDPLPGGLVEDCVGVLDRGPRGFTDARDRSLDPGWSIRMVTDTCAPPASAAWTALRP